MPKSPDSPIVRFLTQKKNLPAVLEVIRHVDNIREYVADQFWDRVQKAIKNHPKALSASFSWGRELPDKSDGCGSLIARPPGLSEEDQGLSYTIETGSTYLGMGLSWNEGSRQFEKLCQLQSLKRLRVELLKQRHDIQWKPDRWWFWWEYWQRNPDTDAWSWFGRDFDDAFFNDLAQKFWDFVLSIHPLVMEANKSLSRSRS